MPYGIITSLRTSLYIAFLKKINPRNDDSNKHIFYNKKCLALNNRSKAF